MNYSTVYLYAVDVTHGIIKWDYFRGIKKELIFIGNLISLTQQEEYRVPKIYIYKSQALKIWLGEVCKKVVRKKSDLPFFNNTHTPFTRDIDIKIRIFSSLYRSKQKYVLQLVTCSNTLNAFILVILS